MQLTPQAEVLVAHTAQLLETLEQAEADLAASLTTVTGTVRIAVFQSAALALMPDALTRMASRYPEVRIEMTQREPETALHETWARDFDLVIAEQYPGHAAPRYAELDRHRLTSDAIRLAVPPRGPGRPAITSLPDTAELAWVMGPRGRRPGTGPSRPAAARDSSPTSASETADLQAQIRLIESGNAVALMPDLVWTGRRTTSQLITLPGDPHRTIFTSVRRSSATRPANLAAREILAETAASSPRRPEPRAEQARVRGSQRCRRPDVRLVPL